MNEIKKLGRDSIIKLGYRQVQKFYTNINISDFEKITVSANSKSVWVSFLTPVIYLPLNSVYNYNLGTDIINGSTTSATISNPQNYKYDGTKISFYISAKESEKHIQFVLKAINNGKPVDSKEFMKDLNGSLIIRDNKNYYEIERVSEQMESFYKIDKATGKIYDEMHAHLIPSPDKEKDPMIEIK